MEHPSQQVFQGQSRTKHLPLCQQLHQLLLGHMGQQIQRQEHRYVSGHGQTGELEDHRPADAVVGELHLSRFLCCQLLSHQQLHHRICPHALQGFRPGGVGVQLHQGGVETGTLVA